MSRRRHPDARVYRLATPGPGLDDPFRVVTGGVVLSGQIGLPLLPGMVWPGARALSERTATATMFGETYLLAPDTTVAYDVTPGEISPACAVITAFALTSQHVPLRERVEHARAALPAHALPDRVLACVVDSTRSTIGKISCGSYAKRSRAVRPRSAQ